jgi:hypothetical protein
VNDCSRSFTNIHVVAAATAATMSSSEGDSRRVTPFVTASAPRSSGADDSDLLKGRALRATTSYHHLAGPFVTGPAVANYPAAKHILKMHPSSRPPRGNSSRVRQLQDLMHGAGGRDPVISSHGYFVDPHTNSRLDYGLPDLQEDEYAIGGAPVHQYSIHPQRALGSHLAIEAGLENMVDRDYGFASDGKAPFINAAGEVFPNDLPVIRIENVSQDNISIPYLQLNRLCLIPPTLTALTNKGG